MNKRGIVSMHQQLVIFTVISKNYLAQAFVLGTSVKKYHSESRFVIFLMDDDAHEFDTVIQEAGFFVLRPADINIPYFTSMVFKYSVIEACTAVKPSVFLHLLSTDGGKVIYLDPDIQCYRFMHELVEALDSYSIVITPHCLSSKNDELNADALFLLYGAYNLGFLGLVAGDDAHKLLVWWQEMLSSNCIIDTTRGLFVDQKWFDLVPCYFDNVYVMRSLAYNIAYWNLHERTLLMRDDALLVQESCEPVAFIHFSSIDIKNPGRLSKYLPPGSCHVDRPDVQDIYRHYVEQLLKHGYEKYSRLTYGYNHYSNGDGISLLERQIYLQYFDTYQGDPFQTGENTFWRFARSLRINAGATGAVPQPAQQAAGGEIDSATISRRFLSGFILSIWSVLGIRNARRALNFLNRQMKHIENDAILEKAKEFNR